MRLLGAPDGRGWACIAIVAFILGLAVFVAFSLVDIYIFWRWGFKGIFGEGVVEDILIPTAITVSLLIAMLLLKGLGALAEPVLRLFRRDADGQL
jgi:hypothetical protein